MEKETYERMNRIIEGYVEKQPEVMNLLKCAEEFQELSLAVVKAMTGNGGYGEIVEEMGDVIIRMNMLMKYVDREKVNARVEYKLDDLEQRYNEKYLDEVKSE